MYPNGYDSVPWKASQLENAGVLKCLELEMQVVHRGRHGDTDEDTVSNTPGVYRTGQPQIGDEEEGEEAHDDICNGGEDALEVQDLEDEDNGLTKDELRRLQKGDSIDILLDLRMKPKELFRLHIPLCRLIAMPMVRPTLAWNDASMRAGSSEQ